MVIHLGYLKNSGDFQNVTREVARGAKSPAAAMAELKPVIQGNLDDLFNQ